MPAEQVPQHCPTQRELDDLELLSIGAAAPITAFNQPGSPLTLELPEDLAAADEVELVDPEGLPLARLRTATGEVEALTHHQYGPFRRLYLTPTDVRRQYAGATFVPVTDALTTGQIEELRAIGGRVVLLALVGAGTPDLTPVALIRASLAAATLFGGDVVAVPLASHGDAAADHDLGVQVVGTYAGGDPIHALAEPVDGRRDHAAVEPVETYPDAIQAIIDADQPPPDQQGLVLFFTGLSGSGKSTLARALMDQILEQGGRTVTSLDGDVVRRHLSAGLTFSKEDRETNIRRIGWVAAEIARHGGIAVCSPIAPFAETRAQVREMVEDAGGAFFLVHVATPLEECERRDRKGLYARARRGEIPEFTGISSPYEEPDDAAVRVDTTGRTIEDALSDVTDALLEAGFLDLTSAPTDIETDGPLKVLFVCTANICRSPFMEMLAREQFPEGMEFSSAGVHGFDDRPMDGDMAAVLTERGIDPSGFRSRRLTPSMVEEADLVLTAEAAHRAYILRDHPEAFRKVFSIGQAVRLLEERGEPVAAHALLEALGERRTAADVLDDVADPYGKGPEAAATAGEAIEAALRVLFAKAST